MFEENIDQKIKTNEKKIALYKMRFERYQKAFDQLHEETNTSLEELINFVETPTNFEPHIWEYLEEYKANLENKLNQELENIRNPFKVEQSYAERRSIQNHWLFVR